MTLLLFDPVRRNPERRQDVTQSGCESRSQRPTVASVEQDGQQGARTDREDERLSVHPKQVCVQSPSTVDEAGASSTGVW